MDKVVKNGLVVNMLDRYVTGHSEGYFSYLLTKKLLADFTVMAAKTLAPHVRVNGIAPGVVLPALDMAQPVAASSVGVDDVAHALLTVIEADYMTGQILFVDDGERL